MKKIKISSDGIRKIVTTDNVKVFEEAVDKIHRDSVFENLEYLVFDCQISRNTEYARRLGRRSKELLKKLTIKQIESKFDFLKLKLSLVRRGTCNYAIIILLKRLLLSDFEKFQEKFIKEIWNKNKRISLGFREAFVGALSEDKSHVGSHLDLLESLLDKYGSNAAGSLSIPSIISTWISEDKRRVKGKANLLEKLFREYHSKKSGGLVAEHYFSSKKSIKDNLEFFKIFVEDQGVDDEYYELREKISDSLKEYFKSNKTASLDDLEFVIKHFESDEILEITKGFTVEEILSKKSVIDKIWKEDRNGFDVRSATILWTRYLRENLKEAPDYFEIIFKSMMARSFFYVTFDGEDGLLTSLLSSLDVKVIEENFEKLILLSKCNDESITNWREGFSKVMLKIFSKLSNEFLRSQIDVIKKHAYNPLRTNLILRAIKDNSKTIEVHLEEVVRHYMIRSNGLSSDINKFLEEMTGEEVLAGMDSVVLLCSSQDAYYFNQGMSLLSKLSKEEVKECYLKLLELKHKKLRGTREYCKSSRVDELDKVINKANKVPPCVENFFEKYKE